MPDKKGKTDDSRKIAPVDQPITTTPAKETKTAEDKPILGKFKSQEDLEKAYTELEQKDGTRKKEIGDLRKSHGLLTDEVGQFRTAQANAQQQAEKDASHTDFEAQLKEIETKLEDGDLKIPEALRLQAQIVSEMTLASALPVMDKRTKELLAEKEVDAAETQFYKDFPDYEEVVASGVLEEIMAKHPGIVDETVAYAFYKGEQRYEEGKAEAERIAEGSDRAGKLMKESETPVSTEKPVRKESLSEGDLVKHQLSTLDKIRGKA